MKVQRIASEDVAEGAILRGIGGEPHVVTTVEPHEHPTVKGCIGVARCADGWGISLWSDMDVEVFA